MSDFDRVIDGYHLALDAFMKGDASPAKEFFSRRDDVTLANPFGPVARGWGEVEAAMERAAENYRDGHAVGFERVSAYAVDDLRYIVEVERLRSKVGGLVEEVDLALRVTTIFRREDEQWRIVHRHADPITTPQTPESVVR